ncbi:hypothetical protein IW262DRAFT_1299569 [Armillaria fumosa]|nr:hypothetical protein IW262DRAFT_1299569 [Armillaria fumosa]
MFPFEELDPHLQRLLPFFDDDAMENARERDVLTLQYQLSSNPQDEHAPFVRNLLKSSTRLAGALSTDAYVEEWGDWSLTMKESKTAMLLHPGSSIPASYAVKSSSKRVKETPAPSDDRRPSRTRTSKKPQPPVMPTGKPGPGHLKPIKAEPQPSASGQSRGKRQLADASDLESEAPPTKKSRGGKSVTNKPKAALSKKKTAIEPAPSRGTRSQAKRSPSPAHQSVGDPPGDDENDQVDEEDNLEELNTATSGPGIGGIPVINRRNHKSYPPPSMIPGEGVYLFPTVEPEPIKKDEVRELVKDEAVPNYPCLHCASSARNVPCVFHGWGNNCDACYRGSKSVCSFKAGPLDRYQIRTQAIAYVEATPTNVRKHLEQALNLRHLYELSANTTANIASQYHAALRSVFDLTLRVACTEAPSSLKLVLSDPDLPYQLFVALEQALTARVIQIPELDVASPEGNSSMALPGVSLSNVSYGAVHSTRNPPLSPSAVASANDPVASFQDSTPALSREVSPAESLEDNGSDDKGMVVEDLLDSGEAKSRKKKDKQTKKRSVGVESDEHE